MGTNRKTLLILAAGLGSRYGGNKQTDGLGPDGMPLFAYSIYDSLRAGFSRVVFVIREQDRAPIRAILDRLQCLPAEVEFAVQDLHTAFPPSFSMPVGRSKPFGTVHALLCAAPLLQDGAFAVVNADDYYGFSAFQTLSAALEQGEHAYVSYPLVTTLSAGGGVTRGVCKTREGYLSEIRETFGVKMGPDGRIREEKGRWISPKVQVSMNCWGFQPAVLPVFARAFAEFLTSFDGSEEDLRRELALPTAVDRLLGEIRVRVYPAGEHWFGVTYREDRDSVKAALAALHREGIYPEAL